MNFWRLLNARIRNGRVRVLLVMCAAAIGTGAVIIGLSERLVTDRAWNIPAGLIGALLAATAAAYGQTWASTRVGLWMAGLARQIRRAILTNYIALEPNSLIELDAAATRDSLVSIPREMARAGTDAATALQSFLSTVVCVTGVLLIDPIAGAALLLALKLGAVTTTALVVRARGGNTKTPSDDQRLSQAMDDTIRGIKESRLAAPVAGSNRPTPLEGAIARQRQQGRGRIAWLATETSASAIGRPILAILVVTAARLSYESVDQAVAMLLIAWLIPFDWIVAIPRITSLSGAADRLAVFEASMQETAERWPPSQAPAATDFTRIELREAILRYAPRPGQPGAIIGPVSCQVARGQILLVTGGIGAGKTTLLSTFAGLMAPEAGEMRQDGVPIGPRAIREIAAFVGIDPVVFPGQRIPNCDRPDVRLLIQELGLGALDEIRAGQVPGTDELSRGTRARIALLIAIASDCPLIVLDEWDVGQSASMRTRYYATLLGRLRDSGRAVVVATTDGRHADVADQIVHLQDGRHVEQARGAIPTTSN